ncbi:hypothetical protein ACFL1E_06445 [Candidatus Omnitrophota bacterium]
MKQAKFSTTKFLIITMLLSVCCALGAYKEAYAANVRIHRPKVRLSIASGSSESGTITIANPADKPATVKAYLEDWVYAETQDGIKNFSPPGSTPLSCAPWISFYPAEFTLPAFGSQDVFFVVKVPEGVSGGHYAVLFFETAIGAMQNQEGVNILVKGRLGSLFYIEAGDAQREARLTDVSVTKSDAGLSIAALLENIGNVDITAKGSFNIIDAQGMVFARGRFNDVYTFPGDKGTLSSVWVEDVPPGSYDVIITLDLGEKPLIHESSIAIDSSGSVRYGTTGQ